MAREPLECTCSVLVLLLLLTGSGNFVRGWNMTQSEIMQVNSNRNVFLLIYVPVHQKGSSPFSCGPANESSALSQLTTIAFALNATNEESLLRTGITLGAYVIDYCAQPVRAVTSLYQLLSGEAKLSGISIDPKSIVGVISLNNDVTESIKELLDPLEIPLVSGMMKPEWKSPETSQANNEIRLAVATREWLEAVADFLSNAKTDFISLLISGDYGERAKESFLSLLGDRACVVNTFHVTHESEMKSLARTIAAVSEGHVLVVLADNDQLVLRFLKIYSTTAPSSLQLFVVDDRLLSAKTLATVHVSILHVGSAPDLPSDGFEEFAKELNVRSHGDIDDKWFRELWQQHFACAITPTHSWPLCTGRESLGNITRSPAMDCTLLAIKTLSLGFQNFLTRNCPQRDRINVIDDCGSRARSLLVQESTRALAGDPHKGQEPLLPRKQQQRLIRFHLHYRDSDLNQTSPTIREVASWKNGTIGLVDGVKHALRRAGVVDFPCIDACAHACPDKAARSSAAAVVDPATNFRTTWGLVTSSLSALGMLLVLACFAYLLVVIPSSRGTTVLNYVILFGLFGVFGTNFFFIAAATEVTCSGRRFLMGVAYAIVFSAKLTKVLSIWRRSKREQGSVTSSVAGQQQLQHGEAKPAFVAVVAAGVATFQGCVAAAWLILSPPHVLTPDSSIPLCSPGEKFEETLVISMLYVMLLMALTLTFAAITWKHESNQRESRWILLSTSLTCCAWLLWTIVATQADFPSRSPAIVVGNLIAGFSVVLTLFVPKLYLYSKLLNQAKKLDIRALYPQRRSFRGQAGGVSSLYDPLHPTSTLNSNYSSLSGKGSPRKNHVTHDFPESPLRQNFPCHLGTFSTTASKKRRPASTGTGSLPKRLPKEQQQQPTFPRPVYDGRSQFLVEQQQQHLNQPYPLLTTPKGVNPINYVLPHSRTVQNPSVEYF